MVMNERSGQAAYVLHSRRFSENSLIVELFTQHLGRVTRMAKGTRHANNHRYAVLQPFIPLLVNWYGKGSMPRLTDVEAVGPPHQLIGKLCFCGLYLNEMLLRLTASQDPHPIVFANYTQTLVALAQSDASNQQIEPILRAFEVQLLVQLGLGLILTQDICGQPIDPVGLYLYRAPYGPEPCVAQAGCIRGCTLLALATDTLQPDHLREARGLIRHVLHYHLEGRPLKSRDFF